ncbi:MAG: ATP-binding protein [Anaerolineae bacterium]
MPVISRDIFPLLEQALADRRAIVITGMRRVGKTTSLRWLLERVPSTNKLYIDLERLDNRAVFQEPDYDLVLDFLRNRGLDPGLPLTLALDEIQYVPNLPSVVKYLYDAHGIKFILSGSSSFYLKNYFSESLAGRKVVFELFPLSFGEFLRFRDVPYRQRSAPADMLFDRYEFDRLKGYYDDYISYGGLPDVVLEDRPQAKQELLADILTSYVNVDVRAMADFRKVGDLQQLMRLLALRTGTRLDHTKLAKILGLSRPTLIEYLDFLEMTYVIHRLPAHAGADRAGSLPKKLYFRDNGIAQVLGQPGEGALFENAVCNQLRPYGDLSYLARGNRYEVDFILTSATNSRPVALEVKYHPVEADATKLTAAAREHGIEQSWIIGRYPTASVTDFIWGGLIF